MSLCGPLCAYVGLPQRPTKNLNPKTMQPKLRGGGDEGKRALLHCPNCGHMWASVGLCNAMWVYVCLCVHLWASVGIWEPLLACVGIGVPMWGAVGLCEHM